MIRMVLVCVWLVLQEYVIRSIVLVVERTGFQTSLRCVRPSSSPGVMACIHCMVANVRDRLSIDQL
jgi:hypothetical protein